MQGLQLYKLHNYWIFSFCNASSVSLEFFVFIFTVISSYFHGKETGSQQGELSSRTENHAIVTSGSKGGVPTRSTGSVEIYHLQFFFTTKPNPKNGTGSEGFRILKLTSLADSSYFSNLCKQEDWKRLDQRHKQTIRAIIL